MSILGTIGLIGVSVNDSIVVVAALQALPPHLQRQRKAIGEVVIASTRHILTTTLTTVTGFVPLFSYGGFFGTPRYLSFHRGDRNHPKRTGICPVGMVLSRSSPKGFPSVCF